MNPRVLNLELSKRLAEAGIEFPESYFEWDTCGETWEVLPSKSNPSWEGDYIPAPQLGELLERLPEDKDACIELHGDHCHLYFDELDRPEFMADTPEEASALMLLWLKEGE